MIKLIPAEQLPAGFVYPPQFLRILGLGLTNLEPWWIFEGDLLLDRYVGLRTRYPTRRLVPFARRQDNDDVACWDVSEHPTRVLVIHDFASSGWERPRSYDDFYAWLKNAIDDLIEFDVTGNA